MLARRHVRIALAIAGCAPLAACTNSRAPVAKGARTGSAIASDVAGVVQVTGLPGAAVALTAAGETSATTFVAPEPGKYRFVCTIHVAQGQTGTLIVTPGP